MKTNTLDFDAQALREKILDLAMRGKLVPQDPNDEPASVLLEKIKAEKEQLIKDKKIKKSKPLAPITDDERPFDIPDSWEWVRLGDVNTYNSESVHPDRTPDKTFELYSVPIFPTRKPEIIKGEEIRSNKQAVETGDVLLCKINPRINRVWKVSNFTDNENIASTEWIVVRQREITTEYLRYSLMAPYFRNLLQSNVSGVGGSLTRAKPREVRNYVLPIPPLSEQSRIAAKIAQLFALLRKVESSTQQYAQLQTLLKSKVLDLAMRGKLVEQDPHDEPASVLLEKIKAEKEQLVKEGKIKKSKPLPPIADDEKPFDIPDSWEWVRLGDIIELVSGRDIAKKYHLSHKIHNATPYITGASNIDDKGNITINEWIDNPSVVVTKGTLLLSVKGTIGKIAILQLPKAHIARQIMGIENIYNFNQDFQKYFLESYIGELKRKAKSMIPGISRDDIILAPFPFSPLIEQNKITNKIKKLFSLEIGE
ncbi:restriction endonuclease subunit S [Lactobacillus crispatus]|uniref:restriction endonuclease subunit S n=1 Tax=Lactobacillus crispatus TaxID=47770 RepID=UPI0018E32295|nr:restriction endonuclease subunit S [Lactobacillus crispatus]MBI1695827.1 type I restriction endonuclease subunit S [Lactobacillus crispatus]